MSHSLHRFGTTENLKNDFCIYARAAKGVNRDNCGDKLRKILKIYLSEKYVNYGSSHSGKSFAAGLKPEEYAKTLDNSYGIMCNFSDSDSVKNVLAKLKKENTGISIVVSGLIDEVKGIAKSAGLTPHTALISLGIHGNRKRLSDEKTLQITTMCGHSLVGSRFVESVIEKVKSGKISPREGSILLARPCTCGIFNTERCERLLEEEVKK